jgi:AcrR family transcriptional regulator
VEQKAGPGRPRGFDREKLLVKIQRVFWTHGFEATTLSQLTDATGLYKPSLYAAYGDKKALYLAALDAYLAASGTMAAEALSEPRLKQALARFFDTDLDLFLAERGQGCFLLATAVPVAGLEPEVAKRVTAALANLRAAFEARLAKAQVAGEISATADIVGLADELYSTHVALAVRARAGESRGSLAATTARVVERSGVPQETSA